MRNNVKNRDLGREVVCVNMVSTGTGLWLNRVFSSYLLCMHGVPKGSETVLKLFIFKSPFAAHKDPPTTPTPPFTHVPYPFTYVPILPQPGEQPQSLPELPPVALLRPFVGRGRFSIKLLKSAGKIAGAAEADRISDVRHAPVGVLRKQGGGALDADIADIFGGGHTDALFQFSVQVCAAHPHGAEQPADIEIGVVEVAFDLCV